METGTDTMLFVDDDESDAELALRAIRLKVPALKIITMSNGTDALEYLFRPAASDSASHLSNLKVVMLDLHMPGIDGFEVLRRMKADKNTRAIPVVIFTSSREGKDVESSYRFGANSYVVKPIRMDQYEETVSNIVLYWSQCNETIKEYVSLSTADE